MKWVDKLMFWASGASLLLFACIQAIHPFSVYFEPLGLYIPSYALAIGFAVFILLWMGVLPFADSCSNNSSMETLSNLFPVELLLLLIFAQYHLFTAAALLAALGVLYGLFWWMQRPNAGTWKERRIRHRFFVLMAAVLFAVPSGMVLFVYGVDTRTQRPRTELIEQLVAEAGQQKRQDAPPADEALLECFRQQNWSGYTLEEKLALAQQLVDSEADRLGVPTVEVYTLKEEGNTLGHYSNASNTIAVDMEYLENGAVEDVMSTVFHEVYHRYQHYVVEQVDWDSDFSRSAYFATARAWKENRENYVQSDGTEMGDWLYWSQPMEQSARDYAEQRVMEVSWLLRDTDGDGYIPVG